MVKCSTCGTANPDTSKYCCECGASLVRQAGTHTVRDEDLRKITVIFSDLSGYTAMSENLGPEETKAITTRIFSEAAAIAKKFDGRLDRLVGDCALILFGIPRLHEDDAARAIRTALEVHAFVDSLNSAELVARIGRSLAMHTGVNTGTVLAGRTDLEAGSESVVGDSVNLASRLKDAAHAGQILVGADTHRLTAHLFDYESLPPLRLKGKADPVEAHRLLGPKAGRVVGPGFARQAIRSPLVGRDDAVATLSDCLRRPGGGRGGIVFVLGEAGVGKSRLIAEVRQQLAGAQPAPAGGQVSLECLEGRSLSYGRAISYWPFQEILRGYAGIKENDSEEEAWRRLESRVRALFNGETEEMLPYLSYLLAMEPKGPDAERVKSLDGEVVGHRIYLASRRFFQRMAERKPLLLIFEDLHWIDQSSALLLEHLLPVVERSPLLICCVSRPDPGTGGDRLHGIAFKNHPAFCTEVRLAPLSRTDSERLTGNLLDMTSLGPSLREQIVRKAEGNPFFLEETVRALIDSGAAVWDPAAGRWKATEKLQSILIPDSVQGVIMSRVDRLGEGARDVLRTAAVIGRSFLYPVLQKVMEAERSPEALDGYLAELQELEIIRQKQRVPEVEFIFTHALARDAVYESILHQTRRELHARVGQVIESLFAQRVEEFFGLLAYHYVQAESWEKARQYLLMSGDQAEHVSADTEALVLYQQAMTVYMDVFGGQWDPLKRAVVERKMGEAFARKGEHSLALDHFMQALTYIGNALPASRLSVQLAILLEVLRQVGHRMLPWKCSKRTVERDRPVCQEVACTAENICWTTANSELALLSMLRLVNSSERERFPPGLVSGYAFLVFFADSASLQRLANFYAKKVISVIERMRASGTTGQAYAVLAIHENTRARWATVREYAERAVAAYQQGGYWKIRGWRLAIMDFADADIHEGKFAEALSHARELVRLGQDSGDRVVLAWGLARQAFSLKGLGRLQDSMDTLKKAMELLQSIPDYFEYVDCGGELGQCHLRLDEIPQALTVFEECSRLRMEYNMLKSPRCTRSVNGEAEAFLLMAEKSDTIDRAQWLQRAGIACTQALKHGQAYLPGMPEAMMLQGRYEWLRGKRAAAQKWWQRSRALAERIGMRYDLARTLFELGRRICRILDLERAKAIFTELGASWDLGRAEEAECSLGGDQ